ncbi:hypothetical protein TCAL_09045 [Tigriopus californicus]|uniref:Tox-ART-HYD1 domain-containing protein n=1 Tax=Tigriopus californicus TaxID=6832 RepID=A0A553PN84_TIGCA|nr:uncharacterized protein LOC131882180 [Tigriopus californicus]TRY79137.1 hypothetical protein TCAL_09045 [Tigriopus californicus]|eukprot:TCALIF_09045-PA protein Name:"Protein of unknown function" AED:0.00 eAED:0.00 QI:20/1/1/1/1/1/2/27/140
MSSKKNGTFYHYTDNNGGEKIMASGSINSSIKSQGGRDAVLGNGVYLTSIAPKKRTEHIAANNWSNGKSRAIKDGKLDNAVKVKLTDTAMKNLTRDTGGRDVHLYRSNNGLDLNDKSVVQNYSVFDRVPQRIKRQQRENK